MMKLTNDAHATVDEIERLTRQEQEQILQVREAELALQAAQIILERSKAALERTQHDKFHAFAWLSTLSMQARAGVMREHANTIAADQALGKRTKIEIGDVVRLKSGGLGMTVVFVGEKFVEVALYTDGRFVTRRLPPAALVVVVHEPKPETAETAEMDVVY